MAGTLRSEILTGRIDPCESVAVCCRLTVEAVISNPEYGFR
jgi:hypothetical protein